MKRRKLNNKHDEDFSLPSQDPSMAYPDTKPTMLQENSMKFPLADQINSPEDLIPINKKKAKENINNSPLDSNSWSFSSQQTPMVTLPSSIDPIKVYNFIEFLFIFHNNYIFLFFN